MVNIISKTIFLDLDGTIWEHPGELYNVFEYEPKVLPGVHKKIQEWHMKGYRIILVTARSNSMKKITVKQLKKAKIYYNDLLMDLPRGERIIINDKKPNSEESVATAISVNRNEGFENIDL